MDYSAQIYRGQGPARWAVLHFKTRTWMFPAKTGKKAAEARARELNEYMRANP